MKIYEKVKYWTKTNPFQHNQGNKVFHWNFSIVKFIFQICIPRGLFQTGCIKSGLDWSVFWELHLHCLLQPTLPSNIISFCIFLFKNFSIVEFLPWQILYFSIMHSFAAFQTGWGCISLDWAGVFSWNSICIICNVELCHAKFIIKNTTTKKDTQIRKYVCQ